MNFLATICEGLFIIVITRGVHKPMLPSFDINPTYVRIHPVKFLGPFASSPIRKMPDFVLVAHKDGGFSFYLSRTDGLQRRQAIEEEGIINFVGVLKYFESDGCSQRESDQDHLVSSGCHIIDHRENNHSYFFMIERSEISAAIFLALFLCLSEEVGVND